MGSKIEARRLAQEAGVPVVPPPQHAQNQNSRALGAPAPEASGRDFSKLGLPVLIKASAGGGGRGMRIVREAGEFQEAFAAAQGEAERAFGDGSLLVEKYVEGARHVEIQIFGDQHGNLMHLFERDCSIQRRHQKIIEESPSSALNPELRERMGEAALRLAKKIGYTNAGTVEFLLAPQHAQSTRSAEGEFYFIEVNTRIQVEHPVTELVTGLDLIRLQIEIAQGERLPEKRPQINGHAIEARLYAEDPLNNFLPATGTLHVWEPPTGMNDVRIDSGVEAGSEIGVHYDPLLAKVIAHAPDREHAQQKLVYALKHFAVLGVETNREFLIDVLESGEFRSGRGHTGFQLEPKRHDKCDEVFEEVARAYALHSERASREILPSVPVKWGRGEVTGDRLQVTEKTTAKPACLRPAPPQPGAAVPHDSRSITAAVPVEILKVSGETVEAVVDGIQYHFKVKAGSEDSRTFYIWSVLGQRTVVLPERYPRRQGAGERQTANSPMPGQVLRILVTEGQQVKTGDALIALEAMKMEQTIKATMDGIVGKILVKPGEIVAPGQKLVEIIG
jgi:acetyl/propionyl-CoA carboxylase alpha subunit